MLVSTVPVRKRLEYAVIHARTRSRTRSRSHALAHAHAHAHAHTPSAERGHRRGSRQPLDEAAEGGAGGRLRRTPAFELECG